MQGTETYRFGPYVLDTARMALSRGEREIELRPKAFETLLVLLRNAGRVVLKDDLVAAVWPDVIVNDDALAQCVRDVRKALEDGDQSYVRTVSRRGYMFVHPLTPGTWDLPDAARRRRLPFALAGVAAALIAAGLAALFVLWPWGQSGAGGPSPFTRDPRLTIAVLPFDAAGGSGEDGWLGEGLAEDIMTALSRFRDLAVIARNSTSRYGNGPLDPVELRRDLNADFLLQGSLRRSGEGFRLAVQLVDLHTGTNRWADQYDSPLAGFLAIQDTIAGEVATQLAREARDAVLTRVQGLPPEQLDAYELVLRCRSLWRSFSREATLEALGLAERAVELDPGYGVAWELLAQILLQLYIQPYDERAGDADTLDRARAAAERAVALDANYAAARATLGGILSRTGDYEASLAALREAIRLNPNDANAIISYADILARAGLHRESLEAWDAVGQLDPVGTPLSHALRARSRVLLGEHEQALADARECAARAPVFQPCLVFLAISAEAGGAQETAREAAARLLEVNPAFTIGDHQTRVPYRREEDTRRLATLLRAAGLPD